MFALPSHRMTADAGGTATREAPFHFHGVTLDGYAGVVAGLAEGLPIADVLRNERVDPAVWPDAEEAFQDLLADDEEGLVQARFDELLAAAQTRYGRSVKPLDDDVGAWLDFARLFAAAEEPLSFLASLGVRSTDLLRLHRCWAERIADDPQVADAARAALEREPRALPALLFGDRVLRPPPDDRAAPDRLPVEPKAAIPRADDEEDDEDDDDASAPPEGSEPPFFAPLPGAAAPPVEAAPAPMPAAPPPPARREEPAPLPPPLRTAPPPAPHDEPATLEAQPSPIPRSALPFITGSFAAATSAPREPVAQSVASPLPFQPARAPSGPQGSATPPAVALTSSPAAPKAPAPPEANAGEATLAATPSPLRAVLPFQPAPRPHAPAEAHPTAAHRPAAPPVAPLPTLTLEQYASMCAELAVFHDRPQAVFAKYGLSEPGQRAAVDAAWKARLARYPSEKAEWERRYWQYEASWRRSRR
jgi:hypothetical protein